MSSKAEIDARYLEEHALLEQSFYQRHEITEAQFKALHADLWRRHEAELRMAGLWEEPMVGRDLGKEMDSIVTRVSEIEKQLGTTPKDTGSNKTTIGKAVDLMKRAIGRA